MPRPATGKTALVILIFYFIADSSVHGLCAVGGLDFEAAVARKERSVFREVGTNIVWDGPGIRCAASGLFATHKVYVAEGRDVNETANEIAREFVKL